MYYAQIGNRREKNQGKCNAKKSQVWIQSLLLKCIAQKPERSGSLVAIVRRLPAFRARSYSLM